MNFFKIMSTLALLIIGQNLFPQITSGSKVIGGSISIWNESSSSKVGNSTQDGDKMFQYSLNPQLGIFLNENLALGIKLGYSFRRLDNSNGQVTKRSVFDFAPYLRYYHMFDDKVGFFGQGEIYAGFESFGRDSERKNTNVGGNIIPGLVYFAGKNIALEVMFGSISSNYSIQKYSDDNKIHTFSTGIFVNSGFTFGVSVYLD
jgi:hypothetical protein